MKTVNEDKMTFWEHIEIFRKVLFKCFAIWAVCTVGSFCFKDIFTLLLVTVPLYILYEISICVVARTKNNGHKPQNQGMENSEKC